MQGFRRFSKVPDLFAKVSDLFVKVSDLFVKISDLFVKDSSRPELKAELSRSASLSSSQMKSLSRKRNLQIVDINPFTPKSVKSKIVKFQFQNYRLVKIEKLKQTAPQKITAQQLSNE